MFGCAAGLVLLENSLSKPANLSVASAAIAGTTCPTVQKTFENEATCVRQESCAAVEYSSVSITLNTTMLRKFYQVGGRYVYFVTGLRLEHTFEISPCSGVSRWRRHASACDVETNLDSATKATITEHIQNSSDTGSPHVRDIEVVTGTCNSNLDGVSAIGSKFDIDSVCWEHVVRKPFFCEPSSLVVHTASA